MEENQVTPFDIPATAPDNHEPDPVQDAASDNNVTPDASEAIPPGPRERSTIKFPYGDLEEATEVAEATFALGGSPELDQLSAKLGHTTINSGGFQGKIATARVFGVVERDGSKIKLTKLGQGIVHPDDRPRALADAFLGVELYRRVFDQYRGQLLPPNDGLENYMKSVGVAAKQADKARQAMQRSAVTAGFFAQGTNRLIVPSTASNGGGGSSINGKTHPEANEEMAALQSEIENLRQENQKLKSGAGSIVGLPGNLPPSIVGILHLLPLEDDKPWTKIRSDNCAKIFKMTIEEEFADRIKPPVS